MKKLLKIVNKDTGEILEKIEFTGGYNVTFTNLEDKGDLRHIKTLDNGKFDHKHWIKNYIYKPIAIKLIEKFKELNHIDWNEILFIEDTKWEPTAATKYPWIGRCKKASKEIEAMTGYQYIIETREYYTERMTREQIIALIYHELRHIDDDGSIKKHTIEDWNNMIATLGPKWWKNKEKIKNLLEEDFHWGVLRQEGKQINMFTNGTIKVVK